jgi:hypothetical protein
LTPLGLRSLAPGEPGYAPHYGGGPRERDSIYHQGAVWPWLMGAFVDAWVRTRGGGDAVKCDARARFVAPLMARLDEAALGHLCEIADAEGPVHAARLSVPGLVARGAAAPRVSDLAHGHGGENAATQPRAHADRGCDELAAAAALLASLLAPQTSRTRPGRGRRRRRSARR